MTPFMAMAGSYVSNGYGRGQQWDCTWVININIAIGNATGNCISADTRILHVVFMDISVAGAHTQAKSRPACGVGRACASDGALHGNMCSSARLNCVYVCPGGLYSTCAETCNSCWHCIAIMHGHMGCCPVIHHRCCRCWPLGWRCAIVVYAS